jgi:hypothetical protein
MANSRTLLHSYTASAKLLLVTNGQLAHDIIFWIAFVMQKNFLKFIQTIVIRHDFRAKILAIS